MNSMQDEAPIVQPVNAQKKNRRNFYLMIAVFALPIILAKFALDGEWLATGVTNKGTLLDNGLTLEQLGIEKPEFHEQWLMLYNLPGHCDIDCQKTLETVHNTYVALGKEMPRVSPVALYRSELSSEQLQQISKSQWHLLAASVKAKELLDKPQVLIVDPLGNVFMSHVIPNSAGDLPQFGKQILADMKKLLKYSKVG